MTPPKYENHVNLNVKLIKMEKLKIIKFDMFEDHAKAAKSVVTKHYYNKYRNNPMPEIMKQQF